MRTPTSTAGSSSSARTIDTPSSGETCRCCSSFADQKYYEDGGSTDTSDDLDYAGLKDYLEGKFREVKSIRYEVRYRDVSRGRNEEVFVDYTYSASYKIPTPKGDVWRRRVSDNRLELKPDGEPLQDPRRNVAGSLGVRRRSELFDDFEDAPARAAGNQTQHDVVAEQPLLPCAAGVIVTRTTR